MKRILFLILALPMLVFMASCDHTDDVNVTFSMDFGPDVTVVNGKAYVVSTGACGRSTQSILPPSRRWPTGSMACRSIL